jgi:hypothetical protein
MAALWYRAPCILLKAVRTSEESICFNDATRRYISEGSDLHTRRRENLNFFLKYVGNVQHFPDVNILLSNLDKTSSGLKNKHSKEFQEIRDCQNL